MIPSILNSVKKNMGIAEANTDFDEDLLMHTNSTFAILHQLGVGPTDCFYIEDDTATWDDFTTDPRYNGVKSYVYAKVRMVFDMPGTSFSQESMKEVIREFEWRLNVVYEGDTWIDPNA